MKSSRKITQITLVSIGIVLIVATYFLYPRLNEKIVEKNITEYEPAQTEDKKSNVFENVEYQGLYNTNTTFSVKSERALILNDKPDLIYMNKMKVTIAMDDGRLIVITSDKGRYNKVTYDCFFENNVKATDNDTVIFSDNLDLLASKDFATIYNDVLITNDSGSLIADKIDYNFETKYYKVSMYNNEKVKVKLIR